MENNTNRNVLGDVHQKIIRQLLNKPKFQSEGNINALKQVVGVDQNLRAHIAELYKQMNDLNEPALAVELLSDHVAIMVEMIREFKKIS